MDEVTFYCDWDEILVDGTLMRVRETRHSHPRFRWGFQFVPESKTTAGYAVYIYRMTGIDLWCRDLFGPPARPKQTDARLIEGGAWWRTEETFRFSGMSEASAFKLFWS